MPKIIWTTPSVYRTIREMFPLAERREVLEEVSRYGGWDSVQDIIDSLTAGRARVQMAIIINSRGDKQAVKRCVEAAKVDFRDVLLEAQMASDTRFPFW